MSFKKEISILSHIAKSYRPSNFRKTACPKKHLALIKKYRFFYIPKTVLAIELLSQKYRIYGHNRPNFSPKIGLKINVANIDGLVTFFAVYITSEVTNMLKTNFSNSF